MKVNCFYLNLTKSIGIVIDSNLLLICFAIFQIIGREIFHVVKEKHGVQFNNFIEEKICPLVGNIMKENFGLDNSQLKEFSKDIDIIISGATTTNFFERYDVFIGCRVFTYSLQFSNEWSFRYSLSQNKVLTRDIILIILFVNFIYYMYICNSCKGIRTREIYTYMYLSYCKYQLCIILLITTHHLVAALLVKQICFFLAGRFAVGGTRWTSCTFGVVLHQPDGTFKLFHWFSMNIYYYSSLLLLLHAIIFIFSSDFDAQMLVRIWCFILDIWCKVCWCYC